MSADCAEYISGRAPSGPPHSAPSSAAERARRPTHRRRRRPFGARMTASWWTVVVWGAALAAAAPPGRGSPGESGLPPSCDSQIYCQGELLDTVQKARLYSDSKTFVDMSLRYSPQETLEQFEVLMQQTERKPSEAQIRIFVDNYFIGGEELVNTTIPDWVPSPAIISKITDKNLREWAQDLNVLWKNLSRRVSDDVRENSDRHSLIYVPNNFVVPGGRFRELYYWDTYWVVRGLLLCEMRDTVKGIIENFLYLLDNYGIIPNGGRIYYLQRSQPPLLAPMVYSYFEATHDVDFIKTNIHLLEKEFEFWMKDRTTKVTVDGVTYTLARYFAQSEGPRPESYWEDYNNAQGFTNPERKEEFYIDIKSAAESGWDFSCRWFINNGTNNGNLSSIHTRYIIPADLNAFIYSYADILAKLHLELRNLKQASKYAQIADQWKEAVAAVLWSEEHGVWFDYDMLNKKQREYFYPSNLAPLWTKCYDERKVAYIAERVVKYIDGTAVHDYLGGIPTSLDRTGEQWDLPNAWPPLQSIIIQGLENTKQPSAQKLAYEFASQWVSANYKGYTTTSEMFEKYDAEKPGEYGGGGEYQVQSGFGWTNGVILELLDTYGDRLKTNSTRRRKRSLMDMLSPV